MQLRPNYRDAMLFAGLLYRQKALAYPDDRDFGEACLKAAEDWRQRAEPSAAPGAVSL